MKQHLTFTFSLALCIGLIFPAKGQGIIDNTDSPHYKFKSTDIGDCRWTNGFWADKFKICEEQMVPYMGELLCGDTGHALNNFKIAARLKEGEHKGMRWHDGDFYKWLEAALYIYAQNGDKNLLKQVDEHISIIAQAQMDDGYLQTQAQVRDDIERYTNRRNHEMYNSGHLFTAVCIHHRITGKSNFLDVAVKQADLMCIIFGPESSHFGRFGFNQTQIIGLVELYRTTRELKYLELAEKFINRRGQYKVDHNTATQAYPIGDMVQERVPIRESTEAVGHAVLALYYYAGAADVYAETGEQALIDALDRLWANITERKMYITGGVGQGHYGITKNRDKVQEAFLDEYMMPNLTAYNETCANVCNAMFNYRMLGLHGESKYADIMELVLYNSALSGISLDGKKYFYGNPLRMILGSIDNSHNKDATELEEREPYLHCFCCPPNLVRTIAKVSGWAYSLSDNGVAVNMYGGNELNTKLLDGSDINLSQVTNYPWDGKVQLTIKECKPSAFEIMLRIPEWAAEATVLVNGNPSAVDVVPGKYTKLIRRWNVGDIISLDLPLTVDLMEGHPRVEEVKNQVAVRRGPVVYCVESPDLPEGTAITDVYIDSNAVLEPTYKKDILGGVSVLKGPLLLRTDSSRGMYSKVTKPQLAKYETQLVPFYSWSNRGKAEMTVFMPVVW